MAEDTMSRRTWTSKTGNQRYKLALKHIKCNKKWQQIDGPVIPRSLNSTGTGARFIQQKTSVKWT